jgi:hypothetical protein
MCLCWIHPLPWLSVWQETEILLIGHNSVAAIASCRRRATVRTTFSWNEMSTKGRQFIVIIVQRSTFTRIRVVSRATHDVSPFLEQRTEVSVEGSSLNTVASENLSTKGSRSKFKSRAGLNPMWQWTCCHIYRQRDDSDRMANFVSYCRFGFFGPYHRIYILHCIWKSFSIKYCDEGLNKVGSYGNCRGENAIISRKGWRILYCAALMSRISQLYIRQSGKGSSF